jgi:flagellar motility protein MotE (MotC chaperone)
MRNLRILPVTILAMVLVFGLKLGNFWSDTQGVLVGLEVTTVQAQAKKADPVPAPEKAAQSTDEEADSEEAAESRPTFDVSDLSESEIEVLQKLSERRDVLDQRDQELDMRDKLLQATEKRIDGKIVELKNIEATIEDLLKQYDKQQLKKLKSLVTIYEKMKPKDAARIFNNLDLEVLLDVTGLMKESKLAAILGKMNGTRAKELTVELATRKQLPDVDGGKS